jgi:hypothetical protein
VSKHPLGSVEKAQPLLREQLERLHAGSFENGPRRDCSAVDEYLSLSDDGKGKVGKRGEVTRCTNRSLGRDGRKNVLVEKRQKEADELWPHP